MSNLLISVRIGLLVGSLLLLAVFLSGFGYNGATNVGQTFRDYRSVARTQMLAANISEDLAQARMAGLKLRLTGDYSFESEVVSNIDEIATAVESISTIVQAEDVRQTLTTLTDDIELYRQRFLQGMAMQDLAARETFFREQLDVIGPMVAGALDKVQNELEATQNTIGPKGDRQVTDITDTLLWTSLIAVLVGGVLAFFMSRSITLPLTGITDRMTYLAETGDTSKLTEGTKRGDEIGKMAKALEAFRLSLVEKQKADQRQRELEEQAERQRMEQEEILRQREKEKMAREAEMAEQQLQERQALRERLSKQFEQEFKTTVEALARSSLAMADVASDMMNVASATTDESQTANASAESSALQVSEVSTATTQMSAATQEISRQVTKTSQATHEAAGVTNDSANRIASLNEAATRITQVVSLISDIAEQTNLLALNATIEAARAGEAGKGFAVVASEVKSLAVQTASATQEISDQVTGMRTAVEETVASMSTISQQVETISDIASGVASAVEEQTSTVDQIAHNSSGAAQETDKVATAIGHVREQAEKTGSQARSVFDSAKSMTTETSQLLRRVDEFMEKLAQA